MISTIISNILWIIYSITEGIREAYLFYFEVNSTITKPFQLHPLFTVQRGIVLLTLGGLMYFGGLGLYAIPAVVALMLIFTYFHDGYYYVTRHKLDNKTYPLGWKSETSTSNAKINMNYTVRTTAMIIGILIELAVFFIKK
jgi:hypothetical protein